MCEIEGVRNCVCFKNRNAERESQPDSASQTVQLPPVVNENAEGFTDLRTFRRAVSPARTNPQPSAPPSRGRTYVQSLLPSLPGVVRPYVPLARLWSTGMRLGEVLWEEGGRVSAY